MAIENIQYVHDHVRFYSRALRPEKNKKTETTKKINWNLPENPVEALKPCFAPQNMFNLAFRKRK